MTMLQVERARVLYRDGFQELEALAGVDLEVAPGEIVGIIGPNGAGKSTLMSAIAGLVPLDGGSIRLDGRPLERTVACRRLVGIAPQDEGVYPTMTVRENLEFFARLAGIRGRELETVVTSVARELVLEGLLDRTVGTLSGGQRRRVHTGLALVHQPRLLLLDEPTSGVDVETRAALLESIRARARQGTAICYSTHDLQELERLDCRVVVLDRGRIIAEGSTSGLVAAHAEATIEVAFDGAAPPLGVVGARGERVEGERVLVEIDDPGEQLATVVAAATSTGRRVLGVRVVDATLEAAYVRLVGTPPSDQE